MLVISPAGLENYFKEVANAVRTGKITWELEKEIASQYGQQFWIVLIIGDNNLIADNNDVYLY